jgi:tetratricopeptide (TPR) repeat protein
MSLNDFKQEISKLKKDGKYTEALAYFKSNMNSFIDQIGGDEYLLSDIITCLRKSNQLDAAFRFIELYDLKIDENQKERILTAYGWLLWSKFKAEHAIHTDKFDNKDTLVDDDDHETIDIQPIDKSELLIRIETLFPILFNIESDYTKTLISNLFNIVLKSEKKKPTPNWNLINDFCNRIDRNKLSTDCDTITVERKGTPSQMELASDFENWYAYKTKALAKLGQWEECCILSKEALDKIHKFHYSNDVWFLRRIAFSMIKSGDCDSAIKELQIILKKKKEWFIQKELAELYFEKNDLERSFKYAIDAINNFGPIEFKVDLLFLLGKMLKQKNELELSFKHFSYSKLLRETEEWSVPQKLLFELSLFSYPVVPINETNKFRNELQNYWRSFNPVVDTDVQQTGRIDKILNNNEKGVNGYIKSKDKKSFYFNIPKNDKLIKDIVIGLEVSFKVKPPKDKGKKENAIHVKTLK